MLLEHIFLPFFPHKRCAKENQHICVGDRLSCGIPKQLNAQNWVGVVVKVRQVFLSLFFFLIVCSGCQTTQSSLSKQQTLRLNIGQDPQTLDPRKARDLVSTTVVRMFFEGLTRMGKNGKIEKALADQIDVSEDGLRYSFHLRRSFWSNGDRVTSFDFANSWKSILHPEFPTDTAYQLYVIKNARKAKLGEIGLEEVGIQTPDAETLVVNLEQPVPFFLELVSMVCFAPMPYRGMKENVEHISNGPFLLKSWKHGDEIRAVKNPDYWEAEKIALSNIHLLMMSRDTEIQMFEDKKLDWAGSPLSTIPTDAIESLKKTEEFHISPFAATYFFRVNIKEQIHEKKNPLSSSFFRKALALSLDRKAIVEHLLQGGQKPALGLVPPELGLSDKGYFQDGFQEEARSFLTDALLELDQTLASLEPIELSYRSNERNVAIAQSVQKQWEEKLKIKVKLQAVEPKVFFQRVAQGEYQLAAGDWTADFSDAINFLEVFKYKEASTNNTNWENGKFISLLDQSMVCKNESERKALLREAEEVLMDQLPIIPLFHFALNYLQADSLKEVTLSSLGQIDFRWATFEPIPDD